MHTSMFLKWLGMYTSMMKNLVFYYHIIYYNNYDDIIK